MSARARGAAKAAPPATLSAALLALLAALLVAAALSLVISRYRSRMLFAELELAQQESKTLTADGVRLRADLGRAAQPAMIEAVARRLGMRAIDPVRVVMLPAPGAAVAAPGGPAPASDNRTERR